MAWLVAGFGMYVVLAAVNDWEWFMSHRKAQLFVRMFGRRGARVFYGIIGAGLVVAGVLMAGGILPTHR